MKYLLFTLLNIAILFAQSFQPLPNNVFRMSIEQGSSNYFWDRGETQFTLEGIGKMYFDPFTHNDSTRFSSNFDLYHTGSLYLDKITFGNDTFNITSTIEEWMTQLNSDFNLNLPVLGPQNIDTNVFRYPKGHFSKKDQKKSQLKH